MIQTATLKALGEAARSELVDHILPYWMSRTIDEEEGGFVGRIDGRNNLHAHAPKGLVLNARILWTFASSARILGNKEYANTAKRAYEYIKMTMRDNEYGGGYWLVDYQGQPLETLKRTYAQAFLIYALSEWHLASGMREAKEWAVELFRLIENHTVDSLHGGYYEVYDRTWKRVVSGRLSDKDVLAPKSSNTLLHVLEAYTTLYRIWTDSILYERLSRLITLFLNHVIDANRAQMHLAFNDDWTPVTQEISYGHDIEASWLLVEAVDALNDASLQKDMYATSIEMVDKALEEGVMIDGSIINESGPGGQDTSRIWWPQAEGVVGLLNAFQLTGQERYLDAAWSMWSYIDRHIIDHQHGEWYYSVDEKGHPNVELNKVGPWKCPYHNARACLEVMTRVELLLNKTEAHARVILNDPEQRGGVEGSG